MGMCGIPPHFACRCVYKLPRKSIPDSYHFVEPDDCAACAVVLVVVTVLAFAMSYFFAKARDPTVPPTQPSAADAPSGVISSEGGVEAQILPATAMRSDAAKATACSSRESVDDAPAGTVPPFQAREEVHALDHARFWLNVLIYITHALLTLMSECRTAWMLAWCAWVNSFVLMTFSFVSGVVSKGELTPERAQRTMASTFATYAILNVITDLNAHWARAVFTHGKSQFQLLYTFPDLTHATPAVGWYLQCWITWKMLLPFLRTITDWRKLLGLACFISWFGGYWMIPRNGSFRGDTALGMLPAFVLGYIVPSATFVGVPVRMRQAAGAALFLWLAICLWLAYGWPEECDGAPQHAGPFTASSLFVWAKHMTQYSYFDSNSIADACRPAEHAQASFTPVACRPSYYFWWASRAASHVLALVAGGSFMCLMPDRPTRISRSGRHALYSFLLQDNYFLPFVTFLFDVCGIRACSSPAMFFPVAALCVGGAMMLASAPVRLAVCFAFEPTWLNWLWDQPYKPLPHMRSALLMSLVIWLSDFVYRGFAWELIQSLLKCDADD